MFNKVGQKIKSLAKIICGIGITVSIIAATVMFSIASSVMYGGGALVGIGFVLLILGPLFSWISSFFMYGFGELIDNSDSIKQDILKIRGLSNIPYNYKEMAEKEAVANNSGNKFKMPSNENNCLKVTIPKIVSTPAKENSKRCLMCSRLIPIEQKICVCGSNEFEMIVVAEDNNITNIDAAEAQYLKITCSKCGADLDFMGFTEKDFKNEQNCPFCNAQIYYERDDKNIDDSLRV